MYITGPTVRPGTTPPPHPKYTFPLAIIPSAGEPEPGKGEEAKQRRSGWQMKGELAVPGKEEAHHLWPLLPL